MSVHDELSTPWERKEKHRKILEEEYQKQRAETAIALQLVSRLDEVKQEHHDSGECSNLIEANRFVIKPCKVVAKHSHMWSEEYQYVDIYITDHTGTNLPSEKPNEKWRARGFCVCQSDINQNIQKDGIIYLLGSSGLTNNQKTLKLITNKVYFFDEKRRKDKKKLEAIMSKLSLDEIQFIKKNREKI